MKAVSKVTSYGILILLLAVVSVVVFAVPTAKTPSFFTAYGCTLLAFAAQFVLWHASFHRQADLKSKFLGLPLLAVGAIFLAVQLVVLAVFTAAPFLPLWSSVVANAVVLGAGAACLIASEAGRAEAARVEERVKDRTSFLRELTGELTLLAGAQAEPELRDRLTALAERARYSDPVSSPDLEPLEERLRQGVEALKSGGTDPLTQIAALERLLEERNLKCKLLK